MRVAMVCMLVALMSRVGAAGTDVVFQLDEQNLTGFDDSVSPDATVIEMRDREWIMTGVEASDPRAIGGGGWQFALGSKDAGGVPNEPHCPKWIADALWPRTRSMIESSEVELPVFSLSIATEDRSFDLY